MMCIIGEVPGSLEMCLANLDWLSASVFKIMKRLNLPGSYSNLLQCRLHDTM